MAGERAVEGAGGGWGGERGVEGDGGGAEAGDSAAKTAGSSGDGCGGGLGGLRCCWGLQGQWRRNLQVVMEFIVSATVQGAAYMGPLGSPHIWSFVSRELSASGTKCLTGSVGSAGCLGRQAGIRRDRRAWWHHTPLSSQHTSSRVVADSAARPSREQLLRESAPCPSGPVEGKSNGSRLIGIDHWTSASHLI